ncbi:MAG TPA: alpha-L-rhamnosidase C-terminal domain-containing protein [Candidatus Hydrogenedentes bacterium]|nr:alpha-L-rhamnosidase C-terminal domain-containing protein [Candidatus Hydrogenedentota bacterium]
MQNKPQTPKESEDPVIVVEALTAGFDESTILENVSFSVRRGEILCIVGGSGCGKSTLLKHMIGLIRPKAGRVLVGAADIAEAYNAEYLHTDVPTYDDDTETALALPLFWKLAPPELEPALVDRLLTRLRQHGNHVTTGMIGTKYLVDALAAAGRDDVVWMLVNRKGFPGWHYLLRDDMTSMVEHWGRGDGSYNHVALGAVDAWFYQGLAGIRVDEARPGYEHFAIRPYVPEGLLSHVEAEVETIRGTIRSAWRREGDTVRFDISVPANTTATVVLPCAGRVSESGTVLFDRQVCGQVDGVTDVHAGNGTVTMEVAAGTYAFVCGG